MAQVSAGPGSGSSGGCGAARIEADCASMYDVRHLGAISAIPRDQWDALVDDDAAPFLEWTFLDALEQSGSVGPHVGWRPLHLTAHRDGRLVGAAPAYLRHDSSAEWIDDSVFWLGASQLGIPWFPKVVFAVPHTPVTGRRFLVAPGEDRAAVILSLLRYAELLAKELGASGLQVNFCLEEETSVLADAGFVLRRATQYHWHNRGYGAFDDFLARFTSRRRKQIRKERAAVAAEGIVVRHLRGEEVARFDPSEIWSFYRATYDKYGEVGLLTEAIFPRLVRDFSHRMELLVAERDGRRIGGAICFGSENALFGRYWGALEPVPLLHFEATLHSPVEDCIRRGRRRFEPGHGGEHKLARGFEPSFIHSAHRPFHPALQRLAQLWAAREAPYVLATMREEAKLTGLR